MASRRRPWLAAVLSVAVPGLGHLYAGGFQRALPLLALYAAVEGALLSLVLVVPIPAVNVLAPFALAIAARVLVARDAARAALVAGEPVPAYSRWYSCLIACVLVVALVNPCWAHVYRASVAQAFSIPTGSMDGTLLEGDHLLVAKWVYGWRGPLSGAARFGERGPRRGDVAAYRYPESPSRIFLHRVIGLPGDTVEIRDRKVSVNGASLDEPYARFTEHGRDVWGPKRVPAGAYFVLGDNRDNSRDSRFWGFVKQEAFLGRAVVVYWSWDAEIESVRWERIGHRIE